MLLTAAGADYQYSTVTKLEKGQYFTDDQVEQGAKVCVLMENDAVHLFGTADAIGRTFELTIGGTSVELEVIGIRENWSEMITKMMEMEMESYTYDRDPDNYLWQGF